MMITAVPVKQGALQVGMLNDELLVDELIPGSWREELGLHGPTSNQLAPSPLDKSQASRRQVTQTRPGRVGTPCDRSFSQDTLPSEIRLTRDGNSWASMYPGISGVAA